MTIRRPLDGMLVLDLGQIYNGPYAGLNLGFMGARVLKIEPPEGDITRSWGKVVGGVPGYFHQQNAGKRDLCIDLRAEGAADLVFQLVAKADILIENFRPDVMGRLGLGYETLRAVNPRLIMLSISGFGQGGPESRRPAFAPIVHAEAGLLDRTGRWFGHTHDLPLSTADTNAALHGLVATLAAVILRQRTGLGQHIDIAMIDTSLVTDDNLHYELEDSLATKNLLPDVWETGAGPILISGDFRMIFRLVTRHYGLQDPAGPDATLDDKIRLRRAAIAAFMAGLPDWDAVEAAMARMNLAWGQVRAGEHLADQPTIRHRGTLVQIDDRAGGARPTVQSPYRYSAAESRIRGGAPHRGEHNEQVVFPSGITRFTML